MRAKSMVLLLIAGVCGLVASIGVSQVLERNNNNKGGETPMGELFVAVADIDIGAKLDATNVKLDKWPKDRVPEGAIRKLEDLKDKFPRVRLYAGEPILTAKLMDSNSGVDNSAKIPDGYRVVSVKVTMDEVVSGLVKPGDRVDVIAFVKKSQEINKTMAQTILKDVRVFAINAETERSTDASSGDQVIAKTVSLLVKPNQVESVMLAAELGKLRLSMRKPGDNTPHDDDDGTDIDELLGDSNRRLEESKATPAESPGGIYSMLNKQPEPPVAPVAPPAPAPAPVAPIAEAAPVEIVPQFRMTILSPTGTQQFEWHDPKALPTTVSGSQAVPGRGPSSLPLAPALDALPPAASAPQTEAPTNTADQNEDTDAASSREE